MSSQCGVCRQKIALSLKLKAYSSQRYLSHPEEWTGVLPQELRLMLSVDVLPAQEWCRAILPWRPSTAALGCVQDLINHF